MANPPPRVLVISADQWRRAGLRAQLREAGYDAIGATSVEYAVRSVMPDPPRGAVKVVIADQDALDPRAVETLGRWRAALGAAIVLVAHATHQPPPGPWTDVLRRPLSVEEVVSAVRRIAPLDDAAARPLDLPE